MQWHARKALHQLAADTIGLPLDHYHLHGKLEPVVNEVWEATQDPRLFTFYDTPMYVRSCVDCFCDFTKGNVQSFAEWWKENDPPSRGKERILDLGAGIGASTRLLHELTGELCIYHSYGRGEQALVARAFGADLFAKYDENETNVIVDVKPDVVVAFELLEHVKRPVALMKDITDAGTRVFCCANSFTQEGDLGHWREYLVDDEVVPRKDMGRRFGKEMRAMGWTRVETGFWNGNPQVWTRYA